MKNQVWVVNWWTNINMLIDHDFDSRQLQKHHELDNFIHTPILQAKELRLRAGV